MDDLTEDEILMAMLLTNAVKKLPAKQLIVVALRSAGYTQLECGTILGVTEASISSWFTAAKNTLRKILEDSS